MKSSTALSERDDLSLSSNEWNIFSQLSTVLQPFHDVTKKMSGEEYVTASQVIGLTNGLLHVCKLLQKEPFHKTVLGIVTKLQEGLMSRFNNIKRLRNASICTFLDPRFKLLPFSTDSNKQTVKKIVTDLVVQELNATINKQNLQQQGNEEEQYETKEDE